MAGGQASLTARRPGSELSEDLPRVYSPMARRGARGVISPVAVARYSEHSVAQDLEPLTIDEVTESSPLRIFRAAVTAAFMLEDERDFRTAVEL